MLTAIATLILIALLAIAKVLNDLRNDAFAMWRCPDCGGLGYPPGSRQPEEEKCRTCYGTKTLSGAVVRSLFLIGGRLENINETVLRLWACPSCQGSGETLNLNNIMEPAKECETCRGTGRRN
jgi:DnaJ-class molecular chaperone